MYLNTARHRRALTMIQSLNSDSENNQCWVYKRKYFEKYFHKKRANKKAKTMKVITTFAEFYNMMKLKRSEKNNK